MQAGEDCPACFLNKFITNPRSLAGIQNFEPLLRRDKAAKTQIFLNGFF